MKFIWDAYPTANWVIGLVFIVLVLSLLFYTLVKTVHRRPVFIFLGLLSLILLLSYLFNITAIFVLSAVILGSGVSVAFYANLGDFRKFLSSPFKRVAAKNANFGVEKIFDRKALYKIVETTVLSLSRTRTGAIITFEKNTSLKDIIKNGVPIHAPVSYEMLATIFYPGTRLHDGAVVIHGNEIVAASVFYTPTTKPFAGKYGSRHRAAIGISEVSDAVTVVVSEETGRISFAVNGQLESVEPDSFIRALENYLDEPTSEE